TLISDDISGIGDHISALGGHLIFRYDADGRQVTGAELRWGSEKKMRATLEAHRPGTTHQISYNPADLGEVNTILTYGWDLFSTPVIAAVFSLLLIFGGLVVYRWSYDLPLTSQIPSYPDDNSTHSRSRRQLAEACARGSTYTSGRDSDKNQVRKSHLEHSCETLSPKYY